MRFALLLIVSFLFSIESLALPSLSAFSVYTDYTSSPVAGTPVTLVASVAYPVREVHVFDSSGLPMQLIITSGPYITSVDIPPGGDNYALKISKGDQIQIVQLTTSASSGVDILTLLY